MSAGLTLATIYNQVAVNVQDVDPTTHLPTFAYWQKSWIVSWINAAIREVCAECQLIKQYVTFGPNPSPVLSSNATAEYVPALQSGTAAPTVPDYTNLDQIVFLQAGNIILQQVSPQAAAEMYWDWDTRTGTPDLFLYNDWAPGVVKLIADPGQTLTTVRGIATLKPPTLIVTDDDNTYPPFDSEFHDLCEFYATARALLMDAETQDIPKANLWMGMYQAKLAKLKAKQGRNFSQASRTVPHVPF